jgi:plasmid stabilization system protein ParE
VKVQLIIRPEAEAEMTESFTWYEDRVAGLGSDFLLCIDAILNSISRSPKQYPIVYENIRRAISRRFPYEVFYVENEDKVIILAVFHAKRSPKTWQQRG